MSKTLYPRVLYTFVDASGTKKAFAIHGDLAYFPSELNKPCHDALAPELASFFDRYIAQRRDAPSTPYVEAVLKKATKDHGPFLEVCLTGLGASGVQNLFGVTTFRATPAYVIYAPVGDCAHQHFSTLSEPLQQALDQCGLAPQEAPRG